MTTLHVPPVSPGVDAVPGRRLLRLPRFLAIAVLTLCMVWVTPSAYALTNGQTAFANAVGRSVTIVGKSPAAGAARMAGPWGWVGLALGTAGVLAIESHKEGLWELPWAEGNSWFDGGLFEGIFNGGKPYRLNDANLKWHGFKIVDNKAEWTHEHTGPDGSSAIRSIQTYSAQCRTTSGTVAQRQGTGTSAVVSALSGSPQYRIATHALAVCNTGETIDRVEVRAPTKEEYDGSNLKDATQSTQDQYWSTSTRFSFSLPADQLTTKPVYRSTLDCVDSTGAHHEIMQETDAKTGKANIPSCKSLGMTVGRGGLTVEPIDGTTGEKMGPPLVETIPDGSQYTDCDPLLGTPCQVEVEVDGKRCVVGAADCVNWPSIAAAEPDRVKCFVGTQAVHISQCNIQEGAYRNGGTPAVAENIDGDPQTWREPSSVPGYVPHITTDIGPEPDPSWTVGDPWPDPHTSTEAPPESEPTAEPTTGTEPQPEPTAPTGPECWDNCTPPAPEGVDTDTKNCLAGAVSWNPVHWVFVPVKCAMTWAFKPDPTKLRTHAQGIQTQISDKGLGAPIDEVGSVVASIPAGGGGCMGPGIPINLWTVQDTIYPVNACGDMAPVANSARMFIALSVSLAGAVACLRFLASGFGYDFKMRATTDGEA